MATQRPGSAKNINGFVTLFALAAVVSGMGCGASTASYTRFRRAAEEGRVVAAAEVRAEDFIAYHATEDAPRPPPSADLAAPVWLDARAGSPVMPLDAARVALQVSLRGGVAAARYPSRLVVLVDVSGSMQEGDKIGAVRHALARLFERLDPLDQIAIVAFSDAAHLALPPSVVGESRDVVLGAIGQLSAYGGTNLYEGMTVALRTADAMRRDGVVTRMIVLSDGVASVGVTDRGSFDALARDAHDRGIAITTVGMGTAIDHALLESVARTAGGEMHYLDRPAEVERLFATELVSLLAMAARDVRVRVAIPPGWSLAQSYAERTELVGGVLETRVGDLPSDGAFVVLHELVAPAYGGDAAVPVEIVLTFADGSSRVVAQTTVPITRRALTSYAVAEDPMVLRNLTLGRSAVAVRMASGALASGDARSAWTVLASALGEARQARATLAARGESGRAGSLDEPITLLEQTLAAVPAPPPSTTWTVSGGSGSSAFAGWR